MNTGQLISGLAHIGLISVAVFGGAFRSEPLPFEMTEVTAISAEEYAALIARPEPEALANVNTPEAPDAGETEVATPQPDIAPNAGQSELSEITPPDTIPERPAEPEAPQPPEDVAMVVPDVVPEPLPEVSPEAVPQPAPRVAPEPVARDVREQLDAVSRIELGFPHDFFTNEMVQNFTFGGMRDLIDDHRAEIRSK